MDLFNLYVGILAHVAQQLHWNDVFRHVVASSGCALATNLTRCHFHSENLCVGWTISYYYINWLTPNKELIKLLRRSFRYKIQQIFVCIFFIVRWISKWNNDLWILVWCNITIFSLAQRKNWIQQLDYYESNLLFYKWWDFF